MGVHHAFWTASCAGCVHDKQVVILVGLFLRIMLVGAGQCLFVGQRKDRLVLSHTDPVLDTAAGGNAGAKIGDNGGKLGFKNNYPGAAILEDKPEFIRGEAPVQRHQHDPRFGRTEEAFKEFVPVMQHECRPVAAPEPQRLEHGTTLVGPGIELGERKALVCSHVIKRFPVGIEVRSGGERITYIETGGHSIASFL